MLVFHQKRDLQKITRTAKRKDPFTMTPKFRFWEAKFVQAVLVQLGCIWYKVELFEILGPLQLPCHDNSVVPQLHIVTYC